MYLHSRSVHNHLLGLENIQFEIILFGPGFDVCEFGWYKRGLIRRGYQVAIIGIFIQKYEETERVEIRDMDDECRRANPLLIVFIIVYHNTRNKI